LCAPLLKLIEKKGLFGFTREMREQLADALEADVLDQDLIEDLLVAAYMRHLEIASLGGDVEDCSAVQCSAVQCSAVQCSAVQCSAVQCSAVQCSAVQCSAVQHSRHHWW
jgi:hypothetical protein